MIWIEIGGPSVSEPTRHGFGTRLINRLAGELQGEVQLKYQPAGFVCEFSVPIVRPT
jgi:two-component sensor histidine kinase